MYIPEIAPFSDKELRTYLQREFDKVSLEFANLNTSAIIFDEQNKYPDRPIENMVMSFSSALAGVAGLYQYIGGSWVKL